MTDSGYETKIMGLVFELLCMKDDLTSQSEDASKRSDRAEVGTLLPIINRLTDVISKADSGVEKRIAGLKARIIELGRQNASCIREAESAKARIAALECQLAEKSARIGELEMLERPFPYVNEKFPKLAAVMREYWGVINPVSTPTNTTVGHAIDEALGFTRPKDGTPSRDGLAIARFIVPDGIKTR